MQQSCHQEIALCVTNMLLEEASSPSYPTLEAVSKNQNGFFLVNRTGEKPWPWVWGEQCNSISKKLLKKKLCSFGFFF